jgi:hypothetical protein
MDAVKYLKTLRRMCNCECHKCEIWKRLSGVESCTVWIETHPEEAVAIVEQWAAEHPAKTRQSVFLEQFPNAPIYTNTHNVALKPCLVDTTLRGHCPTGRGCDICRREFWMQEVEE